MENKDIENKYSNKTKLKFKSVMSLISKKDGFNMGNNNNDHNRIINPYSSDNLSF